MRRAVAEGDALVYARFPVNYRMEHDGGSPYHAGRGVLEHLTSASGGRVFDAKDGRAMVAACDGLATELRSQYTLVLPPFAARKRGGWRDLKVRISGPRDAGGKALKLKVRARTGYYDPARR